MFFTPYIYNVHILFIVCPSLHFSGVILFSSNLCPPHAIIGPAAPLHEENTMPTLRRIIFRAIRTVFYICVIGYFGSTLSCTHDSFDYEYYNQHIVIIDSAQMQRAIAACANSSNYGKSVGIFGGSHSCTTYSWIQRQCLERYLNLNVTVYGVGSHGFSSLQGSIQDQVDAAGKHDIYILWASTNDFSGNREPGRVTDFTTADGYAPERRTTQCGGINYCIDQLRRKNPEAKIYLFGSLKFFTSEKGYRWDTRATNKLGYTYRQYIELEEAVAAQAGIPFFDQYHTIPIDEHNFRMCFMPDLLHHSATGYANIGFHQLEFIATH